MPRQRVAHLAPVGCLCPRRSQQPRKHLHRQHFAFSAATEATNPRRCLWQQLPRPQSRSSQVAQGFPPGTAGVWRCQEQPLCTLCAQWVPRFGSSAQQSQFGPSTNFLRSGAPRGTPASSVGTVTLAPAQKPTAAPRRLRQKREGRAARWRSVSVPQHPKSTLAPNRKSAKHRPGTTAPHHPRSLPQAGPKGAREG